MRYDRMINRHSAIIALLATLIALLVTLPFATAYFRAYKPQAIPSWMSAFVQASPDLFEFAASTRVYQIYWRVYSLVIPLTILALLALKKQTGTHTRISLWGWRVFFAGVLLMGVGIIGDYWPRQDGFWISLGFMFEMIGMVVLGVGAVLYGIAALKENAVPRWIGFGLVGIAPIGVLGLLLFSHIPSGPLLGYVLFWLIPFGQVYQPSGGSS